MVGWHDAVTRHDDAIAPEASHRVCAGPREHAFHHESLFYSGEEGFVGGTLPYIEQALSNGEPALVAVGQDRGDSLREALAGDATRVGFTDIRVLASNPARIIPAWRRFLDEHGTGAGSVRGIAEPVWPGRSNAELSECRRHESLLNVAFDGGRPWRLLCPYDVDALDDEVIAAAHESHPFVAGEGVSQANAAYRSLADGWSPFDGVLPAPAGEPQGIRFTCEELASLRHSVAGLAGESLLSGGRTEDLILAVSELATNSIYHGGGQGTLHMWKEGSTLLCEVSDHGQFSEPLAGRVYPPPDQWSGRGLWLANQLCDLVQIRSTSAGSVVRLHMRLD